MKSYLKRSSVGCGIFQLLDDFCTLSKLNSPIQQAHDYNITERIPFDLWLECLGKINNQYQQDGLGLDIGILAQPHHIGIVAYIAKSCSQLSEYISLMPKYEKLWFDYVSKKYRIFKDNFTISWDKPAYLQSGIYTQETAISEEIYIAILYRHLMILTDLDQDIFLGLELARAKPQDIQKYEKFFNCPIKFDAIKSKIILSKSLLNIKLQDADPILFEILSNQANWFLEDIPIEDPFIEEVHLETIKAIANNKVHIDDISEALNISSRTLQNRLRKRDISFKYILNSIRSELAKKYLKNDDLNITEIAFLLSYKDQTSFNRAFKSWTGLNPSTWRQKYG
ncbi:helix-turn-helix domain-containing protein [Acinetobacter gerneri]|uniref:Helix-turn-helix domain-containing protein n=1 Tax=Acinetobacter gerneri TaxID=202952 RepID=A0AAW8JQ60_9GAMM|nr:helix-turn-helix domain-containing protein [Acinetobacter gerneri]MDQ9010427.1 helix-turn-helix domain-containing protein [Acinetobacter gerneri]MDQ9014626.1 helix-turn-helix domain-containing protein [Acinetobacter gerneri]MDQ9025797.1 helix-turn-helix domain-containing protein [Acinetobacter gerneri]MDQ9053078.1 helix-turn-helix domain-containing protein [Acinetobacter gerneri]MDQ9060696.1 helix-turn-helix domain-containing protein [Acinetobacter gerneri]